MTLGVLLLAFGGPEQPEQLESYLQELLASARIPKQRLPDLLKRYQTIGGCSPVNRIIAQQAEALRNELAARGQSWPVYVCNRHAVPRIHEALRQMAHDRIDYALGFIMVPHRTGPTIERYLKAVEQARRELQQEGLAPPEVSYLPPWYDHPLYIDAVADRVTHALASFQAQHWLYTAQTVSQVVAARSPYVAELRRTAELVSQKFEAINWDLAFHSPNGSARGWLGPDVLDLLRKSREAVLLIPIGFLVDHVEVLHDLDYEVAAWARSAHLPLARAATVGDHPLFIRMIAELVCAQADALLSRATARRAPAETVALSEQRS